MKYTLVNEYPGKKLTEQYDGTPQEIADLIHILDTKKEIDMMESELFGEDGYE